MQHLCTHVWAMLRQIVASTFIYPIKDFCFLSVE
ncbi:hypothetical protein D918_03216 [Trichuris suis]|nr:hypothetical protein D918_03216 [Trichuris suis]